jgi:hypothetical protein
MDPVTDGSRVRKVHPVPWDTRAVRLTEFWVRMERHLGPSYARSWARDMVLSQLDGRTVQQALDQGVDTKTVWRAVVTALDLPARER